MSDSAQSSPYSSEVDEDDLELNEYAEDEPEAEPEPEVEEVDDGEGEADDSDEDEDADSDEDSEAEEEEEEEDQEDAEGDDVDDDEGDLEAALENMEAMDEEPPEYDSIGKDEDVHMAAAAVLPDLKPETPAQRRRANFVTNPPFPRSYTIDPICAVPHPVATHCLASSQCMSYLLTGSEDGFVRCYDFFASVNGKTYLTAPQRHHCGVGEGTMKAGVLKMWWENHGGDAAMDPSTAGEDGGPAGGGGKALSSVHSMVMQADALWGLSGTATGHINLTTIRHDPGRTHHTFAAHSKPVSCLALQPDEQAFLSAGWDGDTKQWDLNTGQMIRMFGTPRHSGGAQVVSLGLRPLTPLATAPTTNPLSDLFSSTGDAAAANDSDGSLFGDSDDNDEDSDEEAGNPGNRNQTQRAKASKANGHGAMSGPTATRNSSSLSPDIVMTAYIDGQVLLWDRRAPEHSKPLRLEMGEKSPPWCVSACWSANGHEIYAGRRIGTIDVWDIRQAGNGNNSAASGPRLLKSLRNPSSSGPVTCVAGFPDGQHLVCASQDNIRLWKVSDETMPEHRRTAPFKIIAGHHGGVISQILVDSSSRFLVTASGNRGWFWLGESTKTVLIHDMTAVR